MAKGSVAVGDTLIARRDRDRAPYGYPLAKGIPAIADKKQQ
jgi:hypothetical protein